MFSRSDERLLFRRCYPRSMAAIIISHNSSRDLGGCIEALLGAGDSSPIVVVDNASADDSVDVARGFGDRVEVLALGENTGFAGGCNRGFAAVRDRAEFVAFLNPDVRVERGCLDRCAEVMRDDPSVGGVAPLLLREDGRTVDSAGQVLKPWTLEVRDRGYGRPLGPEWLEPRPVLAACGALAVFRREALDAVSEPGGPWAEDFFCFWEDLELGWRLNNAGWEVVFEPSARAVHGRGAGAAPGRGPLRWRRPVDLEACILTNRWMTLIRHLDGLDLALRLPVLWAWDLVLTGTGILRRPSLAARVIRRWPLIRRELRSRRFRPRKRVSELPW